MIKFVTELPEYADVTVSVSAWAFNDFETADVSIQQSGVTINIAASDVDTFIEELVKARVAAETKLAEAKAGLVEA